MSDLEVDMTDEDFIDEVRTSMSGLSIISDGNILQTRDRIVVPDINDALTDKQKEEIDKQKFETAVIMKTAEVSFKSWLPKIRKRLSELEVELDPDEYKENLEEKSKRGLSKIGIIEDDGGSVEFVETTQGDLW